VFAQAENNARVPHIDHAFVIMMENHGYQEIINNANAPFTNRYARIANLANNYYAVGHPSLTNYLEVVGGSNFGVTSDNYPNWHHGPSNPTLIDPIGGTGMDAMTPVTDRRNGARADRRKGATWKGSETQFRTPSRMLVFASFFNA
jgi:hypothetical protein